jgi:hypothetical protein
MDVYQKVLVKLYEITGDRENVDIDMSELLRREGFYSSISEIIGKMSGEGWITESRPKTVRLTHWGVMAAKKANDDTPDIANIIDRQADRLQTEVKEFVILVEEFNGKSTSDNFSRLDKKLAEINSVTAKIRENI